jgi:DNA-binding response OmpR family regulator
MYEECLRFAGFRVEAVSEAFTALRLAHELKPDLILMDAALPGLSGWDAIAALKRAASTRRIPVLMITGHVLQGSREKAIEVGADGFLGKPCLPDALIREIRTALRKKPRSRNVEARPLQKAPDTIQGAGRRLMKGRARSRRRPRS